MWSHFNQPQVFYIFWKNRILGLGGVLTSNYFIRILFTAFTPPQTTSNDSQWEIFKTIAHNLILWCPKCIYFTKIFKKVIDIQTFIQTQTIISFTTKLSTEWMILRTYRNNSNLHNPHFTIHATNTSPLTRIDQTAPPCEISTKPTLHSHQYH